MGILTSLTAQKGSLYTCRGLQLSHGMQRHPRMGNIVRYVVLSNEIIDELCRSPLAFLRILASGLRNRLTAVVDKELTIRLPDPSTRQNTSADLTSRPPMDRPASLVC